MPLIRANDTLTWQLKVYLKRIAMVAFHALLSRGGKVWLLEGSLLTIERVGFLFCLFIFSFFFVNDSLVGGQSWRQESCGQQWQMNYAMWTFGWSFFKHIFIRKIYTNWERDLENPVLVNSRFNRNRIVWKAAVWSHGLGIHGLWNRGLPILGWGCGLARELAWQAQPQKPGMKYLF